MADKKLLSLLKAVYPKLDCQKLSDKLTDLVDTARQEREDENTPFPLDETVCMLITYADILKKENEPPLKTQYDFLNTRVKEFISLIHFLPFFPWSSDDGFSVIDYENIDPLSGSWEDVHRYKKDYSLSFDAVFNHISSQSSWFQNYLSGDEKYKSFFIETDPEEDISKVTRPRSLPLLTEYKTSQGVRQLWTTFSADQLDLNFKDPNVLLETARILLSYLNHGARVIRLDAIAFLWKEPGTTCLHLPQAHTVVKIYRRLCELLDKDAVILTETNVPHPENISYFGNGKDEAKMVYQFSLPPLTAHALLKGDTSYLYKWTEVLEEPPGDCTFLNFLASHDGVGVRPAQGYLPQQELDYLVAAAISGGGAVSYKNNSDGSKSPYELNINYLDLLSQGDIDSGIQKFILAHTLLLSMPGVPAIYFHSLFGSRNDHRGVEETGMLRSINREKPRVEELSPELDQEGHTRNIVFNTLRQRFKLRKKIKAFHPKSGFSFLKLDAGIFALSRGRGGERLLCLFNFTDKKKELKLPEEWAGIKKTETISNTQITAGKLLLQPWQAVWLKPAS